MVRVAAVAARAGFQVHIAVKVLEVEGPADTKEDDGDRPVDDVVKVLEVQRPTDVEKVAEDAVKDVKDGEDAVKEPSRKSPEAGVAGVPLTFCPKALRWRDPQRGHFVKTPMASMLTPQERAYVQECKAAAASNRVARRPSAVLVPKHAEVPKHV